MFRLVVALAATATCAAHPSFEEWAAQYGMNSADDAMLANYEATIAEIDELNAQHSGATYAVNQFSGMSFEEFAAQMLTATDGDDVFGDMHYLGEELEEPIVNASVDWDVTPVKDQGKCGSCWAFGTMGSIEATYKHKAGKEVILAEQQLVDCSKKNKGCNGGIAEQAMSYLSGKDIFTSESYPYTAKGGSCRTGKASGVTISGYTNTRKTDSALVSALNNDAITVSVKCNSQWKSYKSGVISGAPTDCGHNHAVTLTGYTDEYFKIKNSWKKSWGEDGFMRFQRNPSAKCGPFGIYTKGGAIPKVGPAPEGQSLGLQV